MSTINLHDTVKVVRLDARLELRHSGFELGMLVGQCGKCIEKWSDDSGLVRIKFGDLTRGEGIDLWFNESCLEVVDNETE